MELGDSDNRSLVATSGTCSISGCLAAEITRPPCSTKSWRLTLGDVFAAALKHGIQNSETETESRNHGITETETETEYGICKRRFQAIDLKKEY